MKSLPYIFFLKSYFRVACATYFKLFFIVNDKATHLEASSHFILFFISFIYLVLPCVATRISLASTPRHPSCLGGKIVCSGKHRKNRYTLRLSMFSAFSLCAMTMHRNYARIIAQSIFSISTVVPPKYFC